MQSRFYKLLIIGATLIAIFTPTAQAEEFDSNQFKILEIYQLLKDYHINSPDSYTMTNAAIHSMIASLHDPYTEYFTENQFQDYLNSLAGSYTGVGIVVEEDQGNLKVYHVFDGSPAKTAGIQVGDILIKVDDMLVTDLPFETVMSHVIGDEGTTVELTFTRHTRDFQVSVVRKAIDTPQVFTKFLPEKIGYIHLTTFSDGTMDQLNKAISSLKGQGAKGIILDLRDNPGGFLATAQQVASRFVDKGTLVIVRDSKGREENIPILEKTAKESIPLAVLVNENSASSSEIVAATLQDHHRATIIGTPTYGKGTIQEVVPLQAGGYLKLTIEEYSTSLHKPINHVGVTPDILVGDETEQLQAATYVLLDKNKVTLGDKGKVLVNGKPEVGPSKVAVFHQGKWYISLRKVAYLFHGKLAYEPIEKKITLQIGDQAHSFRNKGHKGLMIEKGLSYLQLEELLRYYPQLEWNQEEEELSLQPEELKES